MKMMVDNGKRTQYESGALREPQEGKGRFDLITPYGLMRLARWYELGAKKYADRNWEKGMPWSRYVDSAFRHLVKYMMGDRSEDHLAAIAWNVFALMHYEDNVERYAKFCDLPFFEDWLKRKEAEANKSSAQVNSKGGWLGYEKCGC